MKRSRFTEQQIVGVLKQAESGMAVKELLPEARHLGCDLLQLEGEVRRDGRLGPEAAEGARGGEREAEEDVRGSGA